MKVKEENQLNKPDKTVIFEVVSWSKVVRGPSLDLKPTMDEYIKYRLQNVTVSAT